MYRLQVLNAFYWHTAALNHGTALPSIDMCPLPPPAPPPPPLRGPSFFGRSLVAGPGDLSLSLCSFAMSATPPENRQSRHKRLPSCLLHKFLWSCVIATTASRSRMACWLTSAAFANITIGAFWSDLGVAANDIGIWQASSTRLQQQAATG